VESIQQHQYTIPLPVGFYVTMTKCVNDDTLCLTVPLTCHSKVGWSAV